MAALGILKLCLIVITSATVSQEFLRIVYTLVLLYHQLNRLLVWTSQSLNGI